MMDHIILFLGGGIWEEELQPYCKYLMLSGGQESEMKMNQYFAYQSVQVNCFYNSIDFVIIVMTQQPGVGNSQELHPCSMVPLASSHSNSLCTFHIFMQFHRSLFRVLHPFTALSVTMTTTVCSLFFKKDQVYLWYPQPTLFLNTFKDRTNWPFEIQKIPGVLHFTLCNLALFLLVTDFDTSILLQISLNLSSKIFLFKHF